MAKRTSSRPAVSPPYPNRVKRLRRSFPELGVDAALISDPIDIRYLTGFHGEASFALVERRRVTIISDRRFETELASVGGIKPYIRSTGEGMIDAVANLYANTGTVCLQSDHLTVSQFDKLVGVLGKTNVYAAEHLVLDLRRVKDDAEVAAISRAIELQEAAMEALLEQIEPGMAETEVAALLEYEMRALGASGPSFSTIAAVDANAALPHARPGSAKTRSGGIILLDWGASIGGYVGDLTRVFAFGRWPKQMAEVYDIVEDAMHAGVEAVRPGMTGRELDGVSRTVIDEAGYGPHFAHSLGHGIGMVVHESPRVSQVSDDILDEGMVITIEPGIYLPGVGGVRLEQDVLVTGRGGKVLSSLPTDRAWATLA